MVLEAGGQISAMDMVKGIAEHPFISASSISNRQLAGILDRVRVNIVTIGEVQNITEEI